MAKLTSAIEDQAKLLTCRIMPLMTNLGASLSYSPERRDEHVTPHYSFETTHVPEPAPSTDLIYSVPVSPIDSRAISFEIKREKMQLINDMGDFDVHDNIDILDSLDSPLLAQLDPNLKSYILEFFYSKESADLKSALFKHQEWITEFNPAISACLM